MNNTLARPFEWIGNDPSLDFHNTASWRASGEVENERFVSYESLVRWLEESGQGSPEAAESLRHLAERWPDDANRILADARELRRLLHRLFAGVNDSNLRELSNWLANVRLEIGAVENPELRPARVGETLESILHPVVFAAATLVSSENCVLVRSCANDECGWLFVDRSRRGNRKWCEMKDCGNRSKVRNYYRRRKASPAVIE